MRRPHAGGEDREPRKRWVALVLAVVAGFVDVVGFFTLFHIGLGHVTGDTEHVGALVSASRWTLAIRYVVPLPMFAAGVAAASTLLEVAVRRRIRRRLALGLGVELALLLAFLLYGAHLGARHPFVRTNLQLFTLTALGASAMGVQTAAVQRVGDRTVRTTFITGMVTRSAESAVRFAFHVADEMRGRTLRSLPGAFARATSRRAFERMLLLAALWWLFLAGGALGGALDLQAGIPALVVPAVVLLGLILIDLARPFEFSSPLPRA